MRTVRAKKGSGAHTFSIISRFFPIHINLKGGASAPIAPPVSDPGKGLGDS